MLLSPLYKEKGRKGGGANGEVAKGEIQKIKGGGRANGEVAKGGDKR